MALFATETRTMRHRLLLTIGAILVVCQLISVFWLWHESKSKSSCWLPAPLRVITIKGTSNMRYARAVASLLVPACRSSVWRYISA